MHLVELEFVKKDSMWWACIPYTEMHMTMLSYHSCSIVRHELEELGIKSSNIYTVAETKNGWEGRDYENMYLVFDDPADEAEFIIKISAL